MTFSSLNYDNLCLFSSMTSLSTVSTFLTTYDISVLFCSSSSNISTTPSEASARLGDEGGVLRPLHLHRGGVYWPGQNCVLHRRGPYHRLSNNSGASSFSQDTIKGSSIGMASSTSPWRSYSDGGLGLPKASNAGNACPHTSRFHTTLQHGNKCLGL